MKEFGLIVLGLGGAAAAAAGFVWCVGYVWASGACAAAGVC